jgi:tetratricopeptide (TPR) repeat protein
MELTTEQALQLAIEAHKAGKLQDAEGLYRAILVAQPKHPDANHNLGVLAFSLDKTELALPLFKTALEANPSQGQFWLSYVDALIKEKQFENASNVLEQGKKRGLTGEKVEVLEAKLTAITLAQNSGSTRSPSQIELNTLLEYYQKGRYDLAQNLATTLTQQYPNHPFGWKVMGALFKKTGKLEDSVIAIQKVLEISPNDAEAHSNLGTTLKELGRLEDAEISCKQAIAIKPDYAEAYYNLGVILQDLGRLEDAEISYNKAIAIKPDLADAHSNLGNTLKEFGRFEDAEISYKKAIAIKPDYAEAHYNLGVTLQELGRLEDAEMSFKKAIAIKPDLSEAHSNLGNTLKELGRLEDAEISCKQAIAIKPDYAEAHYNLGLTLQELGRLEDAEKSYKKAIAIKLDYTEALSNLTSTLLFLDKLNESAQVLLKIIEIDPEGYGLKACVNLAILNFLNGNRSSSKKLLLRSMKILENKKAGFKNEVAYWNYLSILLAGQQNEIDNLEIQKLYVIGESHCLSSHEIYIKKIQSHYLCQSFWIVGCKQWHLGNTLENKYKYKFQKIIKGIPSHSNVLLSIGEIDCRVDHGILNHIKKYPFKDKNKLINSTINNYLKYIFKILTPFSHNVTIQGVPCPNLSVHNNLEDFSNLIELIKEFNVILKQQSHFFGFNFLDLHKLTDRGDGFSNGKWHIDQHHLSPAGMQEAWLTCFIAYSA